MLAKCSNKHEPLRQNEKTFFYVSNMQKDIYYVHDTEFRKMFYYLKTCCLPLVYSYQLKKTHLSPNFRGK